MSPTEDRVSVRAKVCTQDDVGNPLTQSGTDQPDLADRHRVAADTTGRGRGQRQSWEGTRVCAGLDAGDRVRSVRDTHS